MATRKKAQAAAAVDFGAMMDGMDQKAQEATAKQFTAAAAAFKKPNSDYYRLDLVTRQQDAKGKMIEAIKTDYKAYLTAMARAEGLSLTKYLHKLIDEDMERNAKRYEELKQVLNL